MSEVPLYLCSVHPDTRNQFLRAFLIAVFFVVPLFFNSSIKQDCLALSFCERTADAL